MHRIFLLHSLAMPRRCDRRRAARCLAEVGARETTGTWRESAASSGESPPITRVVNVTRPTMTVSGRRTERNRRVILPAAGLEKGRSRSGRNEAADWLNRRSVSAFVLSYRTTADSQTPGWIKPLQDAQRAWPSFAREPTSGEFRPDRIRLVGFSAGGQVAARLLSDGGQRSYDRLDEVDDASHRPDFAILVYPWNMYDAKADALIDGVWFPRLSADLSGAYRRRPFVFARRRALLRWAKEVRHSARTSRVRKWRTRLRPSSVAGSQISVGPTTPHWLGSRGFSNSVCSVTLAPLP